MSLLPPFAKTGAAQDDLDAASAEIRKCARWHVWPVLTQTITLDSVGSRSLMLPTLRLVDVTACTVDAYWNYPVVAEDVDPTLLRWSESGWLRFRNWRAWPDEPRSVVLTIKHGLDDRPPDLAQLCVQMAGRAALAPAGRVLTSQSAGGRSESYSVTPYESELERIGVYRLP